MNREREGKRRMHQDQEEQEQEYTDTKTVARAYGKHINTIINWCEWGLLDAHKAGRRWRIPAKYKTGKIAIEIPTKMRTKKEM